MVTTNFKVCIRWSSFVVIKIAEVVQNIKVVKFAKVFKITLQSFGDFVILHWHRNLCKISIISEKGDRRSSVKTTFGNFTLHFISRKKCKYEWSLLLCWGRCLRGLCNCLACMHLRMHAKPCNSGVRFLGLRCFKVLRVLGLSGPGHWGPDL